MQEIFSRVPFKLNLRILEINSNGDNLYIRYCTELTKSYSPFLFSWKRMNPTSKLDRALPAFSQKGKQEHLRRLALATYSDSDWHYFLSLPHTIEDEDIVWKLNMFSV